jgi:hypothetical protein
MTSLERDLAHVLELIEKARAAGNGLALATLLQRRQAICAALAAPEHGWYPPHAVDGDASGAVGPMPLPARSAA